ncbi:hypothetical protein [Roseibium sp.]|uniref:hypothetical protein n=1 Tax=Roseibium sp. TaxID=1936156 RepID=UPI003A97F509
MATLARFSGTQQLPGVRRPQVIADTAVGEATTGLGQQIQKSAAQIGELAQARSEAEDRREAEIRAAHQYQIDHFEGTKRLVAFKSSLPEIEAKALKNVKPGGAGLAAGVVEAYDNGAKQVIANTPPLARPRVQQNLEAQRPLVIARAKKTERVQRVQHYRDGVAEVTATVKASVTADPASYDAALDVCVQTISESGLAPTEKDMLIGSVQREMQLKFAESQPAKERAKYSGEVKEDGGSFHERYMDNLKAVTRAAVGEEAWAALSPGEQAALVSITGSENVIPESVLTATLSLEPEKIATAIEGLKGENGGKNSDRRQQEADLVRGDHPVSNGSPDEDSERFYTRYSENLEAVASAAVREETWAALPPPVRMALVSIVDSEGQIPSGILAAVPSRDPEKIAAAIESLKNDNGGKNADRRQREADLVRSGHPDQDLPPEIRERTDALTPKDRAEISEQGRRDQMKNASDKQESFSRRILESPLDVDPDEFRDDPDLSEGQIGVLNRLYEREMDEQAKKTEASHWFQLAGRANPLDEDAREMADFWWKAEASHAEDRDALANSIVTDKGLIPQSYVNDIKAGFSSQDWRKVAWAYRRASELYDLDRLAVEGNADAEVLIEAVRNWRFYTTEMGLSAEEAAQRLIELRDPEAGPKLRAFQKSSVVKSEINSLTLDRLELLFGSYNKLLSVKGTPAEVRLGITPERAFEALKDYRKMFLQAILETKGDIPQAHMLTMSRFSTVWRPTKFPPPVDKAFILDRTGFKYPAEWAYADFGDSYAYLSDAAESRLAEMGVEYKRYGIVSNRHTFEDVRLGRINADGFGPRMTLMYEDKSGIHVAPGDFRVNIRDAIDKYSPTFPGRAGTESASEYQARLGEFSDFGKLAQISYNSPNISGNSSKQTPSGYSLLDQATSRKNGFNGAAFYNPSNNTLVVAIGGTNPWNPVDGGQDILGVATGGATSQYFPALELTKKSINTLKERGIHSPNVVFTGHSLGGVSAQWLAQSYPNSKAVVFNSPGIGGAWGDIFGAPGSSNPNSKYNSNVTYVYSEKWGRAAPIHAVGVHVPGSKTITIKGTSGHELGNLLEAIESYRLQYGKAHPSPDRARKADRLRLPLKPGGTARDGGRFD